MTVIVPELTTGIDLSDKKFDFVTLAATGEIVEEKSVALTKSQLQKCFGSGPRRRIVLEVGTHSPWISEELARYGHEVCTADPRRLKLITSSSKKNDRNDAVALAQLGMVGLGLLSLVYHRSKQSRAHLGLIKYREAMCQTRCRYITMVRGMLKSYDGTRVPRSSTRTFADKVRDLKIPRGKLPGLERILRAIDEHTRDINAMDKEIDKLAIDEYPEAARIQQIFGVGWLTALTFVLTIEDPRKFKNGRAVAAYLGLCPRQFRSGETDKQLRITKEGDGRLRRLLVICAHRILSATAPDTDLKRFGEALATRGGKNAKKRAVVAVARRLAVLAYSLWMSGEKWEELRNAHLKGEVDSE